jgi:SAM-dependent methyltransferase|tara:strand:- start:6586 stop:7212 length:627 start_codon:yes stop_codon:yes gene_type:complete
LTAAAPAHDPNLLTPAGERNLPHILGFLAPHLPATGRLLEVATGTGGHGEALARAHPGLTVLPTDFNEDAIKALEAWRRTHGPDNFLPPLRLDAADPTTWPDGTFDVALCINMIHISPWSATVGLMKLAGERLPRPGGLFALYGPYVEADTPTAPSNLAFHESLRARDPAWGLRALEDVVSEARLNGLRLTHRAALPANNLGLLFRSV